MTEEVPFASIRHKGPFRTILVDPPWRFKNRTGKIAPEHKRLHRYPTMSLEEIKKLPVEGLADDNCHLYLWTPNALLPQALEVMAEWGFQYKTNLVWCKINGNGDPDKRGVGFWFRNVTELLLLGVRGKERTRGAARKQENFVKWMKQEHSRKPPKMREIIEACSFTPRVELFAREQVAGWVWWGDQAESYAASRNVFPTYRGNGEH